MLRTIAALLCSAGLACAAAPASTPSHSIPRGVTVAGIEVGGLTAEPARALIERSSLRPLRFETPDGPATIDPARTGAVVDVDGAVASALAAVPRSDLAVSVRWSTSLVAQVVDGLARRYDESPVDAVVVGAGASGPRFSPSRAGLAVDRAAARAAIEHLLRDATRAPVHLPTRAVAPRRTAAGFGPVIVVTRLENSLRLYDGRRLVRTFRVATGQAIYPTPAGVWRIVDKQRDPWWYPPTYDTWAKGLQPVPPGPGNPLGTRWMGLDAPGVGIHGTDAPASIGYSASHGCIRMQVPDAEWLFERVRTGTPVVIL